MYVSVYLCPISKAAEDLERPMADILRRHQAVSALCGHLYSNVIGSEAQNKVPGASSAAKKIYEVQ